MIDLESVDKPGVLSDLYNNVYAGVRYYKALQWQVTVVTMALLAGVVGLSQSPTIGITEKTWMQVAFSVFVLFSTCGGIWFVHHAARRLRKQRELRRRIESILGLFDENTYHRQSILPKELKEKEISYWQDWQYVSGFWGVMVVACVFAIVVVWSESP